MKQTEILTHATHVNGWEPAVYMSCMSQNFRLFHVSNLSVRNFRIFLLMYTGSLARPSSSEKSKLPKSKLQLNTHRGQIQIFFSSDWPHSQVSPGHGPLHSIATRASSISGPNLILYSPPPPRRPTRSGASHLQRRDSAVRPVEYPKWRDCRRSHKAQSFRHRPAWPRRGRKLSRSVELISSALASRRRQ